MQRFHSIGRRLLAIALILLMQGPAMLVQEVAWVKMLASYTRERGFTRGVIETFDGRHPCDLCDKAAELRQREQPEDPADKQAPARRMSLAWMEMVSSELLKMPVIAGRDIAVPANPWAGRDGGRGVDAPVPPPPKCG